MARLSDFADLDELALWLLIFEAMEEGLDASNVDGFAPAAPFRMAEQLLDELVARDPDWNCSEIAELRTVLNRALAGESGVTGHA